MSAWHEEVRALPRHAHDAEDFFVVASRWGGRGDGRGGSNWARRRNTAAMARRLQARGVGPPPTHLSTRLSGSDASQACVWRKIRREKM